jgi:hypothetical protein
VVDGRGGGVRRIGALAEVDPSGADRPTSMMMDDVYDSRKDLVSREDLARVRDGLTK